MISAASVYGAVYSTGRRRVGSETKPLSWRWRAAETKSHWLDLESLKRWLRHMFKIKVRTWLTVKIRLKYPSAWSTPKYIVCNRLESMDKWPDGNFAIVLKSAIWWPKNYLIAQQQRNLRVESKQFWLINWLKINNTRREHEVAWRLHHRSWFADLDLMIYPLPSHALTLC